MAFALWAAVVALRWWRRGRDATLPRSVVVGGVAVATVPISTFVANLVPWWRMPSPALVFTLVLATVVAGLTALAVLAGGRRPLGALRLVAVVTLVVLVGDVLTGSGLQLGSVFGQNPVVGGRFYGFGNTSFALYGLAVLVVVAWVAASGRSRTVSRPPRGGASSSRRSGSRRCRRWARTSAGRPGCCSAACSSSPCPPGCGSPGVGSSGRWSARRRSRPSSPGSTGCGPPEARTHLGEFVESVVSGEAGGVVGTQDRPERRQPGLAAAARDLGRRGRPGRRGVADRVEAGGCRRGGAARSRRHGRRGVRRQRLRTRHPRLRGASSSHPSSWR